MKRYCQNRSGVLIEHEQGAYVLLSEVESLPASDCSDYVDMFACGDCYRKYRNNHNMEWPITLFPTEKIHCIGKAEKVRVILIMNGRADK